MRGTLRRPAPRATPRRSRRSLERWPKPPNAQARLPGPGTPARFQVRCGGRARAARHGDGTDGRRDARKTVGADLPQPSPWASHGRLSDRCPPRQPTKNRRSRVRRTRRHARLEPNHQGHRHPTYREGDRYRGGGFQANAFGAEPARIGFAHLVSEAAPWVPASSSPPRHPPPPPFEAWTGTDPQE